MKTFASLFTGGGLADIGAMQAGYELLWGVEIDPQISAIANANLPHRDCVYANSVIGFPWHSVERPDHLHMSPPCQDFSVAKKSGKVSNPNDEIADACIEALKALQPNTVTLENVEGYRKAKSFQKIVDHLWGAGYWVNADVLNAADFGAPQTRRRLILRAVKGGFPKPLPDPVKWQGWYEAIEDLIPELPETQFASWQLERLPDYVKTCQGNSLDLNDLSGLSKEQKDEVIGQWLESQKRKAFLIESKNANQQYGDGVRLAHEPHTTVITDHKPSHQPKILLVDGKGNNSGATVTTVEGFEPSFTVNESGAKQASRATVAGRVVRMTPRCLARFQTVPDWYVLPEKAALACKIIGNGVPCLMMQRVLETI